MTMFVLYAVLFLITMILLVALGARGDLLKNFFILGSVGGVVGLFIYDALSDKAIKRILGSRVQEDLDRVEKRWAELLRLFVLSHAELPQDNRLKVLFYPKFRFRMDRVEIFAAPVENRRYPQVRGDLQQLTSRMRDILIEEMGSIRGQIIAYLFIDRSHNFEVCARSNHEILAARAKYLT
jgi:hypothetical protein